MSRHQIAGLALQDETTQRKQGMRIITGMQHLLAQLIQLRITGIVIGTALL